MRQLLKAFIILTGFVSVGHALAPPAINNSSDPQPSSTMNIGSGTVRGQLSVGSIKLPGNVMITSATINALNGVGASAVNAAGVSAVTLTAQKGVNTSTMTATSTVTVQGVLITGSGAHQITTSAGLLDATKLTGTVPNGSFPATLPAASGVNLTALNASNLASGTVPDARFPGTLPASSGVNLTALNASNLGSGTVPNARFPATLPASSGQNLTALNASALDSGTIPDARFPGTLPAVSGGALIDLNASNLTAGTLPNGRFPATLPAANGSNLTALNATNLGSGTVPDARFPATLPAASGVNLTALNATNLGSGTVPDARFPATLPASSGANLTALNATNLGSGTVPAARMPALSGAVSTSAGSTVTTFTGQISPSTGIAAGTLPTNVPASSATVNAINNSMISDVAASKVTGQIPIASGGTSTGTAPTGGQLLIGTSAGLYRVGSITAGSNVSITLGDGTITINASTSSAGIIVNGVATGTFSMNGYGIVSASTNSWTYALINGASTYWATPPTTTGAPWIMVGQGSNVTPQPVLTGIVTNTSSNTKSGYLMMTSSFGVAASAAPPVDSVGKMGFDTTDGVYIGHDGTAQRVISETTRSFSVYITSGTGWDNLTFPIGAPTSLPFHVTSIRSSVMGGTSLAFNLDTRAYGTINTPGSNLTASSISAAQAGTTSSSLQNTSVPAFGSVVFKTGSSAASGAVDGVFIRVYYTLDVQ